MGPRALLDGSAPGKTAVKLVIEVFDAFAIKADTGARPPMFVQQKPRWQGAVKESGGLPDMVDRGVAVPPGLSKGLERREGKASLRFPGVKEPGGFVVAGQVKNVGASGLDLRWGDLGEVKDPGGQVKEVRGSEVPAEGTQALL